MSANFCRLDIPIQDRPLRDALGMVVPPSLKTGAHLYQWADPIRAMGWFREADRLLNDTSRVATFDTAPAVSNTSSVFSNLQNPTSETPSQNQTRTAAQFQYVLEILQAIARGYNLLNLVWRNDPEARTLYRRWVAGPPMVYGQSYSGSLFAEGEDYNRNWYHESKILPAANRVTKLQTEALDLTKSSPGTGFAISAGLLLSSYQTTKQDMYSDLSDYVYNVPMLRMRYRQVCMATVGFPWRDQCTGWSSGLSQDLGSIKAILPNGTELPSGYDDWRAVYYGRFYNGFAGTGITAPVASYLPWLREWVASLLARNAFQIIQDNRAFAVWQNDSTVNNPANGGGPAAWQKIVTNSTSIEGEMHKPDSGIAFAASAIASASAAFGGVGAVIGGAVAAVIQVANLLVVRGVTGHGRDDLGRYRLQFERSWLSGDPGSTQAGEGAPRLPNEELIDPPGQGSLWVAPPIDNLCGNLVPPTGTVSSPGEKSSNSWMLPAGILLAGGIGYAWWKGMFK